MRFFQKLNVWLVLSPAVLLAVGFITLFSTSADLINRHLLFIFLGITIYLITAFVDYRLFSYCWKYIYVLILITLFLAFLFGTSAFGSARWLGINSYTFQPSEFSKAALIVSLAAFLTYRNDRLSMLMSLLKALGLVVPLIVLVLIQPDLGTASVLLVVAAAILLYAGISKMHFLIAFLLFGVFSSPVWNLLHDYQKRRILIFLNPVLDKLGSGYNVIQSIIAIGSGELLGRGFGRGTQTHLRFLPVFWTDFIFAAFAEEWGFVGVVGMLLAYLILLVIILHILHKISDPFGVLLCAGIFAVFFFQFLVNVGMNLGLLPVTGIPLSLVSYGGSSMLLSFFLLGLVQSVWTHRQ